MQLVQLTISQTQQAKSAEEKELNILEKRLSHSAENIRRLDQKVAEAEQKTQRLQQQQKGIQLDIEGQKEVLANLLRSAYFMGKQQRVKMLLNQQQPDRMSRVMQYYDYFNQAKVGVVSALDKDLLSLKQIERELSREHEQLLMLSEAKRLEKQTLQQTKQQRASVLAVLGKKIQSSSQELAALKQNEKRLTELLTSIRQAINDIPLLVQQNKPFPSLKGKLSWPTKGQIVKTFGSAKKSGRYDGVLIAASEGATIRSISHGRVVYADWLRGYGLLIIVDHGSNYLSLYAFNEGLYKEVGDWVSAGETIAAVGISGGQQKAGLYFSIRKNGKAVNPAHWCRAVKNNRVG
ncbi:MAG: peptidoglycan DD-metalloendopeptidase family protein [Cycloclasticus sp.]|nr:peptidoglycan DD-metalloendopeptidase family protein [Cycloclasticus sp.]MBQ0789260.1 peptidoglycan DD-metalloendopeptidase family protein [Cycloclasticus sp.]